MKTWFGHRGRSVALLLTAAVVLSLVLCACGSKDVSGTYRGSYDMKEELNAELAEAGLQISGDLVADFILTLNSDKTFAFDMDAEGFSQKLIDVFHDEGEGMVRSMLEAEGITEDMYDWVAQASGYDDFSAFVSGMIDEMVAGMGDDMVGELRGEVAYTGTYEVKKNTITLTSEQDNELMMDEGTINDDGSISVSSTYEGKTIDLVFVKQ